MQILGRHALVDLYGCDPGKLDDFEYVEELLTKCAEELNCTIVKKVFHRFSPQGVSGVIVIAESHLSIHTWPEHGYCAVDLYSCDMTCNLDRLPEMIQKGLGAERVEYKKHLRGLVPKNVEKAIEKAS